MIESFRHKGLRKLYETGKHGFSRLTRWRRSGVSFLIWSRLKSHRRWTCRGIGFTNWRVNTRLLFGDGQRKQQNDLSVCGG